jgi:hypothetical protein
MKSSHTEVYFSPPPLSNQQVISATHLLMVQKTYACHESTRKTHSLSILLMYCSRRTMLQFHYVVLSKRNCGSSTGQVGRANVERPIGAGHLQDTVGLERKAGKRQQTFHLVHFV